jgi:hypothetical protein
MSLGHRVRREPLRLTSNDPIETARRNYFDCPSSLAGSPARNLTFHRTNVLSWPTSWLDECSPFSPVEIAMHAAASHSESLL